MARQAAAAGLTAVPEAFADRAYTAQGGLVSRRTAGAVLHDVDTVVERCVEMATKRTVRAIDGSTIDVDARSICVHGDTAGAVEMARAVRAALVAAGVRIEPFTGRD